MPEENPRSFGADFKRFFIRGLAVLLPSVLTLWILVKAYQFVDSAIAQPINTGIRAGILEASMRWSSLGAFFMPEAADQTQNAFQRAELSEAIDFWWNSWNPYLDWIGILVAILAVYVAGRLLGDFLGRRIHRRIERVITAVPLFKQIYPYVKQVVDFLFSDDKPIKFNRVVVVQYPRKGIWSIGLVTGETMKSIKPESGDAITIFIPSSPTPFTGYTITVPRNEARELPISIDEALRFTISGGVLVPSRESLTAPTAGMDPAIRTMNPASPSTLTGEEEDPKPEPRGQ